MNILDEIIAHRRKMIAERKALFPVALLEKSLYFEMPVVSLKQYLKRSDKTGIIAEFKRRSPSKGNINPYASVEQVSIGYMQAGASALSVLTEEQYFGGRNEDLTMARKFNFCPILRKDFIVDEYQLIEAKSIGADAVLLIAECLDKVTLRQLARTAKSLGMEVLMEVHSAEQLDKWSDDIALVGVNNRNLKDFSVNIETSLGMINALPKEVVPISESGLSDASAVVQLRQAGYRGFLIGEHFMKTANPPKTCAAFIQEIRRLSGALKLKNA